MCGVAPSIDVGNKYRKYAFARGFLLSTHECCVHDHWFQSKIDNYHLTYDPLNDFYVEERGGKIVAVLGFLLDIVAETTDASVICSKLLDCYCLSYDEFLTYTDTLCGRYCIFFGNVGGDLHIMQDSTGMRAVFYSEREPLIASHYNLIRDVSDRVYPQLPYYQRYNKLSPRPWILPGHFTPLDGIFELFGNHELNISTGRVRRFWPYKNHEDLPIDYVCDEILNLLKKQINILFKSKEVITSLTAGIDSRLTTSLLKNHRDKTLFYSYVSSADPEKLKDCARAQKIAENFGLSHLTLNLDEISEDDPDFKQIKEISSYNHYHRHVAKAIPLYLTKVPNRKIHLQSNLIEIIREFEMFEGLPLKSNSVDLANKLYSVDKENPELQAMFNKFFTDYEFDKIYNYLSADLIYWEYRMGGWLNAAVLAETDFAFDTYMLFNCRKILQLGLSSPRFYKRNNTCSNYIVQKRPRTTV